MNVELISWTKDPLMTCAIAASVCYDSKPSLQVIKGCIKSGHHSVLEHASFTFKISGISRSCSHQLVRHRIASYSQQSQRYVTLNNPTWVLPTNYMPYDDETERLERIMLASCEKSLEAYEEIAELDSEENNDTARCVLPNATPTTIVVTMNIRTLMNFFNERLCSRAEREIRQVALKMKKLVLNCPDTTADESEIFYNIFVPKCERYDVPFCPESAKNCCGRHKRLEEIVKEEYIK